MNRRSFLLGLGAMACSAPGSPKKPTGRTPPRQDGGTGAGGVVDATVLQSQLRASPLAFQGDTLVQSVGGELRAWDAMAMKRTDTWALPHRHFCFVQDGTLVAFGWPKKGDSTSVIHHIANRKVRTETGPLVPSSKSIVLLPGSKPEELYVVGHDETIYRLTTAKVEEQLRHPYPNGDTRDQWFSRGDGRLVGGRAGALYLVAPNKPATEYAIPERVLKHVAAGTGERVWYSYAEVREDWNAHTIILAPTSTPMEPERTIDVAPLRVVHLASSGSTIAALLIVAGKMPSDLAWKVAVFDESGKERWRADVPSGFSPGAALNNGFVAIGEHRVVVSTFDGALLAWDMTGKPVAPA